MADRKKAIEGLELCLKGLCDICPYKDSDAPGGCKDELMYDAIALLKALDVTPEELERLKMCRAECKIDCLLEHYNNVKDELDAMEKAQEPRVITIADFENNHDLDDLGYLNAWVDYKDGNLCGWATICLKDVGEFVDVRRYWTSRPTDEMRRETPWEMK